MLHFADDAHEGLLVHGQQGERFAESSVTSAPISLTTNICVLKCPGADSACFWRLVRLFEC